jgi:hypothetical protein
LNGASRKSFSKVSRLLLLEFQEASGTFGQVSLFVTQLTVNRGGGWRFHVDRGCRRRGRPRFPFLDSCHFGSLLCIINRIGRQMVDRPCKYLMA